MPSHHCAKDDEIPEVLNCEVRSGDIEIEFHIG